MRQLYINGNIATVDENMSYVECPDCGGKLVYSGEPDGDGIFEDYERETYISAAKVAIANYYRGSTPFYFCI